MVRVNDQGKESSSNFSPDNGTGLQVRTALKDILEALRTFNSDTGDPSGAANLAAYQMHINEVSNTSQILKIRNKANNGFVEIGDVAQTNLGLLLKAGGVMTGVLQSAAGALNAPSLHFGDSGTGFYKKGTNQIGLVANQAEISFLDQNGLSVNNQKEIRFSEQTGNGTNYVALKAPSTVASNLTLTLPAAAPTAATTVSAGSGFALIAIDDSGALGWGWAGGAEGAAGSNNQVFWENDQAVTHSYAITNGKNAGSFGPITINSGVTVTVGSGETWSVV